MNCNTVIGDVQKLSLFDSLDGEWLKLPCQVMKETGPAAQTLGGLLRVTNRETFVSVKEIARFSRLPERTVKRHLQVLVAASWIENLGREKTRGGRRRTCTIRITDYAREHHNHYCILPVWACGYIPGIGRLPWSARALLGLIMARLAMLKVAMYQQDFQGDVDELLEEQWHERFTFSLRLLPVKSCAKWQEPFRRSAFYLVKRGR